MDKDIRDLLKEESKNNMPDLWDNIESKLDDKKRKNIRKFIAVAASLVVILTVGIIAEKITSKDNYFSSNNVNEEQILQSDNIEGTNEDSNENDKLSSSAENSGYESNYNEVALDDTLENYKSIEVLEDLDLDKILEGKTVLSLNVQGNLYSGDSRFINYEEEAESVVYGKVIDVKSFVKFEGRIYSDIAIEVIKDYRNGLKEGETIILGVSGGELTYKEFISQSSEEYVKNHRYDMEEDKSKKLIDIRDGVPVYRVGEYVLVYTNAVDNDPNFKNRDEILNSITCEYFPLKELYVNPNTREIFDYEYLETNKLVKRNVGTLDDLENKYQ